jgi:hypothetical protein
MKQNEAYVEKQTKKTLQLSNEELSSRIDVRDFSSEQVESLKEFIYDFSYVLYKLFSDE